MLDISSAKIKKLIVHRVGNKLRDEGISISPRENPQTDVLNELLLKSFLAPLIRHGEQYQLFHESDINLNIISHYSSVIFKDIKMFQSSSEAIAKHLYSCSTHPNIGGGEFLIILFDDIRTENSSYQALGLFRVENKNDYLDVLEDHGAIKVFERSGISLEKIQKGAIIIENSPEVFILDSLGQKTKYWIDGFLKVIPSQTPQICAKAAGALIKAISNKVESANNALEFGRQIDEILSESDTLSISSLKDISSRFIDADEINELIEGTRLKYGFQLENDLEIESKQFSKYAKDVVTKARITEGVSLLISNPSTRISSIDVTQTKSGFRAIVDIKVEGAQ